MATKRSKYQDFLDDALQYLDLSAELKEHIANDFALLHPDEQDVIFRTVLDNEDNLDTIVNCIKHQNILNVFHSYLINNNQLENYEFTGDIHAYYFLFKKNLKVTNIQFSELISLIKQNAKYEDKTIGDELLFLHIKELKDLSQDFFNSIYQLIKNEDFNSLKNECKTFWHLFFKLLIAYTKEPNGIISYNPILLLKIFTEKYHGLILRSIIIDCFYSSCVIYVPKTITLDLRKICAFSGYINSCGNLIYIKNVEKAQKDNFINKLVAYDGSINRKTKFAVFSHEDSSDDIDETKNPYAFLVKDELKSGLNDLKVYLEKFYMGDSSLIEVVAELEQKSSAGDINLYVPEIDNLQWRGIDETNTNSTIWFHIEHSISEKDITKPGKLRYYICYEQLYKNDNQLHIFDENKPAWKSCTTIPHTLIGAMYNIALQHIIIDRPIRVLDPFLGTGTSLIEGLKYDNVEFYGFDKDKISPLLIEDNVNFIFNGHIEKILEEFPFEIDGQVLSKLIKEYDIEFNAYKKGEYDIKEIDRRGNNLIQKLENENINNRLLIYLLFKTNIKNSGALERQNNFLDASTSHKKLIQKESHILFAQLSELKTLLKDSMSEFNSVIATKRGKFSEKLLLNSKYIFEKFHKWKFKQVFGTRNIRELAIESESGRKYDIIITDPPYGFNVSQKNLELAELFNDFVDILLSVLADDGQILMALPERSYSGKRSPYFTHKEIVVKNFILKASKHGFEVINTVKTLPNIDLFHAPYYWEAEKALRRSIIHLRFRRLVR